MADRLGSGIWVSASLKKNPHIVGGLWSGPRVVSRLWSAVRVSTSFQMFTLTAVGNVLSEGGNCLGGGMSRGIFQSGKCSTLMC